MEGLRLCARYAYMPNQMGYCGPHEANRKILDYVLGKEVDDIRGILSRFEALHPYLNLIARANGVDDEFYGRVVEALWVGNGLLDNVGRADIADMMRDEFGKFLPTKVLDYYCRNLPEGCVPHHSLHVLYLQTVTGVIAKTVENQDNCRISWGKVKSKGEMLSIESQRLKVKHGRYVLEPCVKEVDYKTAGKVFTDVKVGDDVAVHWGLAVEVLDGERLKMLRKYTEHNMRLLNPEIKH